MDVIPLVLSEEAAIKLPDEYFETLAVCSTDVVKQKIKEYLKKPDTNPAAVAKVKLAYCDIFEGDDYLANAERAEAVKAVQDLKYKDITPYMRDDLLTSYEATLIDVLCSEHSIAYSAPISGAIVKTLIENIRLYANAKEDRDLKDFVVKLKKYASLFRDSQFKGYTGTPLKRIMTNVRKFEIILKGIQFIREQKAAEVDPRVWRVL